MDVHIPKAEITVHELSKLSEIRTKKYKFLDVRDDSET